jgi:hypothetical protein
MRRRWQPRYCANAAGEAAAMIIEAAMIAIGTMIDIVALSVSEGAAGRERAAETLLVFLDGLDKMS